MGALSRFLPILSWLPAYRRGDLSGDVIAGLTVAVMLVPQSMAYALLADLPPVVGLYAALIPPAIYAFFGTSRQLAVGPVAMDSLLVAMAVGSLVKAGTPEYLAAAIMLAAMVGAIQLALGLMRAGFLVNFLSKPVVSGFTSAAALIIGFSQLKHLLGFSLPRDHRVHLVLWEAASRLAETHAVTLAIGGTAVIALLGLKRVQKRTGKTIPGALLVVAAGTIAVVLGELDGAGGVRAVGLVPPGLPDIALPLFDVEMMTALLPAAGTIALVAFMEAISVARFVASKEKYRIDPNQELIGLGMANLGGSLVGGYPVAGGFSRTAVNVQAGARTPLAGMITAALVGLTLVLFTPLFEHLPVAVLAAIIMTAVFGLIDLGTARRLWAVSKPDFALLAITFVATLQFGITEGVLTGVAASLVLFLIRSTRPHYAVLGRLGETQVFRNVKHYAQARTVPGVLILRFDAVFYFGNISFLEERLIEEEQRWGALQHVVFDASGINALDASGADALLDICEAYRTRGIGVRFAGVKGPVRVMMDRAGIVESVGADAFFFSVAESLAELDPQAPDCPCPNASPLTVAAQQSAVRSAGAPVASAKASTG